MKQQITKEEYATLTMAQKNIWNTWCFHRDYPPRPNIGRMIEYLTPQYVSLLYDESIMDEHLCDELWEEVKKDLNTKTPPFSGGLASGKLT